MRQLSWEVAKLAQRLNRNCKVERFNPHQCQLWLNPCFACRWSFTQAYPKTSHILSQTGCQSHVLTAALANLPKFFFHFQKRSDMWNRYNFRLITMEGRDISTLWPCRLRWGSGHRSKEDFMVAKGGELWDSNPTVPLTMITQIQHACRKASFACHWACTFSFTKQRAFCSTRLVDVFEPAWRQVSRHLPPESIQHNTA